ncbi:MAG: hypothetical protein HDQ88_09555 [Clostridia bacterium]|nr:hypothetical protein [Clostridia bacterium]
MMIPLWKSTNHTTESDVFHICSGTYAVLFATGLKSKKVKASASEIEGPQVICIQRLAFPDEGVELVMPNPPAGACDYVMDWRRITVPVVYENVAQNGCCWSMTNCNNLMTIEIPGTYRAILNDTTAVNVAQLYLERYYYNETHGCTV